MLKHNDSYVFPRMWWSGLYQVTNLGTGNLSQFVNMNFSWNSFGKPCGGVGGGRDSFQHCGMCPTPLSTCQNSLISMYRALTGKLESLFYSYHCEVDHLLNVCCLSRCRYRAQMGLVIGQPVAFSVSGMVNWEHDGIGMENEGNLLVQSSQLVYGIANYLWEQKKTYLTANN